MSFAAIPINAVSHCLGNPVAMAKRTFLDNFVLWKPVNSFLVYSFFGIILVRGMTHCYRNFITMATRRYSHSFRAGHFGTCVSWIIMHGVTLCCEDLLAMATNPYPHFLSFEDIINLAFSTPMALQVHMALYKPCFIGNRGNIVDIIVIWRQTTLNLVHLYLETSAIHGIYA